jgi:hypothetical protein
MTEKIEIEIINQGENEKETGVLIEATRMIEKESLPALTKALSLVEIDQLALLKNQIDKACDSYRVNVKEVGLEEADKARKTITKYANIGAKWFLDKRSYLKKMADDIRGIEKETLESLTELEAKLKQDIEDEKNRQAKEIALKKLPMRQAYLETLDIVMDDEQIIKLSDVDFQSQVESIQANLAKAKEEAEELERIRQEAAEKAKKEAEAKAEKDKQEALKAAEEAKEKAAKEAEAKLRAAEEEKIRAANKAAADLKAAQEKAEKDKEAAETKAKADKERILGESRYAIIEGLGLAGYCTASKQIVIEKVGVMVEDAWEKSLETLKARKKEAEDKAEREKLEREAEEKARKEAEAVKGLKVETVNDDLVVTHHGKVILEEPTWTDAPEDANLSRAFGWVEPLIRKVYELGFNDGYSEGSSDTASAIQSDISYRNGYLG